MEKSNKTQLITKDLAKEIFDNAPAGVNHESLLNEMVARGYVFEGFNDVKPEVKESNILQTVAGGILNAPSRLYETGLAGTAAGASTLYKNLQGRDTTFGQEYEAAKQIRKDQLGAGTKEFVTGTPLQTEQSVKQAAGDVIQSVATAAPFGGPAKTILGNIALGGATGAGYNLGSALYEDKGLAETLKDTGVGLAVGAAIPGALPFLKYAGRALSKTGEKAVESVIPVSTREASFLQNYKAETPFTTRLTNVLSGISEAPQTAAKTVAEKGLMGTKGGIGIQAKRISEALWNDFIKPALDKADVDVNLPAYFNTLEKNIIETTPEIGRQKALLEALNAVRDDYKGVDNIALSKLQDLKEGWAQFVPQKFYNGKDIAGAVGEVNALLADQARDTIYSALGKDVRKAYFDYGNLKGLQEMGKVAMTGQKLKGGTGGFISEILSETLTPIMTIGGQALYKTGKGIEFVGKAGEKYLGQALGLTNKKAQDLIFPINTQKAQMTKAQTKNVIMKDTIPQSTKAATKKVEKSKANKN